MSGDSTMSTEVRPEVGHPELNPQRLRDADVLLVNDVHIGVALSYQLGQTPRVVAVGRGARAPALIWCAQEMALPIIELTGLDPDLAEHFKVGEEIPEEHYHSVANALAFLYKARAAPSLVRFVRPLKRPPSHLSKRARALVDEFGSILDIPMLYLEVGGDLEAEQAAFEDSLSALRQRVMLELGLPVEPIPFRRQSRLDPDGYAVMFKDTPVHTGQVHVPLDGPEKVFPLINKIKQVLYQEGWELMTYHQVEALLERVRRTHPGLVRQLFPRHFSVAGLRQILRNLLREQVSVRDLPLILEVILENLSLTQDPDLLTEFVRQRYNRSLCRRFLNDQGHLNVVVLSLEFEAELLESLREAAGVRWLEASPDLALRFLRSVGDTLKDVSILNVRCVLLVTPMLRRFLARMVSTVYPDLCVLSYSEIGALTDVRSVGVVGYRASDSLEPAST